MWNRREFHELTNWDVRVSDVTIWDVRVSEMDAPVPVGHVMS
jgi:hypothetical protein